MGVKGNRYDRVGKSGATNNDIEFKANISKTNVNTTSIARQEEGARIINACFAAVAVAA